MFEAKIFFINFNQDNLQLLSEHRSCMRTQVSSIKPDTKEMGINVNDALLHTTCFV